MSDVALWNEICDEALKIRHNWRISQREFAHWMIHANQFYHSEIFELKNKISSKGLWDLYSTYQTSYDLGLRREVFQKFI
jgi:hypothetical protein